MPLTDHRAWRWASLVVIAAGAAVRIRLADQTLMLDELWVVDVLRGSVYIPHAIHQPPLFFFLALAVTKLCGFAETCLRVPALLFGIALGCVPLFARRAIDPATAFIWTTLLTFSSPLVYYSARAKQYTFEAFACAVLLVLFLERRTRAFFAVAVILALGAHAPIFVLAATGTASLVVMRDRLRWALAHFGVAALFAIAYVAYMKPGAGVHERVGDLQQFFTSGPVRRFFDGTFSFVHEQTAHWVGQHLNLTRGFTILAVIAVIVAAVRMRERLVPIAILATLPPLLVLAASAVERYPYGEVRLMAFAAPGLFLLIAVAFAELMRVHRALTLIVLAMLAMFIHREVTARPYDTTYMRTADARRIYDALGARPTGTPVLVREWDSGALRWYDRRATPDLIVVPREQPTPALTVAEVWVIDRADNPFVLRGYRCTDLAQQYDLTLRRCTR